MKTGLHMHLPYIHPTPTTSTPHPPYIHPTSTLHPSCNNTTRKTVNFALLLLVSWLHEYRNVGANIILSCVCVFVWVCVCVCVGRPTLTCIRLKCRFECKFNHFPVFFTLQLFVTQPLNFESFIIKQILLQFFILFLI